jgi:hypothetical protein
LCEEKFIEMGINEWHPVYEHVKIIERVNLTNEALVIPRVEQLKIKLSCCDSDQSDAFCEAEHDL